MKMRVSVAVVRSHAYGPVSTDAPIRPRPACTGEDPELFFPIGNTGPALLQIDEAKAVCRRCPLMESCLEGALERNELGVWGGTDEADRRRMKRRAARQGRTAA
ncbi:WhiB family transcriptional regulator [Streptomyces scabiei]|uniref:WhiB family transcriptional regulator n=1 Tax=Streptomyces scabiei TaxID=1930 RepID=UPI0004E63A61|nr:WhiB family transcriptional regulator [Streptomyces scabiei]KFG06932.1 WhiB family transcriptional regulator [Streptomyces scabiei]MDX2835479.1 WhiB family transcriptional regulator [Streptomyces scabiei]MDX3680477.1 WhiB family transcriptional regulator [Streptomyces scabiei]